MARWIIACLTMAALFIAGDISWISLTGPVIYRPVLGPMLADTVDLGAGAAFYPVYFTGLAAFGLAPGLRNRSPLSSLAWGALFGLVAYGTYDLTNQST
jgi:uncharacterized membrane protein